MTCSSPTKLNFTSEQSLSFPLCVACYCFEARMDEQVSTPVFVLPIVYTTVAVVLREGVYRKIAESTTLQIYLEK